MSISHFIREIGRGKQGARDLTREQAAELMGLVLDGAVPDLQLGAFCIAMRVKGETAQEMAGFLDALDSRLQCIPNKNAAPVVVLPSYNGARRLPLLTPLLALLLSAQGVPVLVHGGNTEASRVSTEDVMQELGCACLTSLRALTDSEVVYAPAALLSPGLWRLLQVRRSLGLRNSAHSLVKMLNPMQGSALLVCSHTHPEYAVSMTHTLSLMQANALLLRGTEGEPVADPRRIPAMTGFVGGHTTLMCEQQAGSLTDMPALPQDNSAQATAMLIQSVLDGQHPVPAPLAKQVSVLCRLAQQIGATIQAPPLP
jgi:anthranilate phosphoribosyltransferase